MTNKKQYYWIDFESGVRYPCTKEYYDAKMKNLEDAKPKFDKNIKFKIPIIYGTGGENYD